ncbi:hypothetical protein GCM10010260_67600 [Streptomyces filipinensis]|uniref:DUF8175 domain-containing protein n=1 Tax=Streptomyces filipinensis TaxID=66887 RepID=A0A918MDT3_9ACTN|nr:hypothetical protein [Streptomyces filipinensis]GGV18293.1 hypothetical protein GCM10010260_67600 [Streptomyces filipinensis]
MLNSGRPRRGSGEWEQPFWQQRGWILSAGFLLVLVVLGAFALMTHGSGGTRGLAHSPTPSGTNAQGGGGGSQGDRPAGCHTDDSDQARPTAPPKDVSWKANGTDLVPVSRTAGPLKFDGSIWSCFAHTPTGAVFAAHAIGDHFAFPGWREVVERQVVPGPGRDEFVAERSKDKDQSLSGQPRGITYTGFSVLSYNKQQATVMLLAGVPGASKYGSLSMTLRWRDGDWKVVADSDGTIFSGVSRVDGTDGFVTWGA